MKDMYDGYGSGYDSERSRSNHLGRRAFRCHRNQRIYKARGLKTSGNRFDLVKAILEFDASRAVAVQTGERKKSVSH
jgi:hypothetical protein